VDGSIDSSQYLPEANGPESVAVSFCKGSTISIQAESGHSKFKAVSAEWKLLFSTANLSSKIEERLNRQKDNLDTEFTYEDFLGK